MVGFYKEFKRLIWFLGIPISIISLLFLVRTFFILSNKEPQDSNIPTSLNPENKVAIGNIKKPSYQEMEDELEKAKKIVYKEDNNKVVPLSFPNQDSIYKSQLKGIHTKTTLKNEGSEIVSNTLNRNERLADHITNKTENIPNNGNLAFNGNNSKRNNSYENNSIRNKTDFIREKGVENYGNRGQNNHTNIDNSADLSNQKFNLYIKSNDSIKINSHEKMIFKTEVLGDQELKEGSELELRSLQDFYTHVQSRRVHIPKNTLVNANIRYQNQRVFLNIQSVKVSDLDIGITMISLGKDGNMGIFPIELGINLEQNTNTTASDAKEEATNTVDQQIIHQLPLFSGTLSKTAKRIFSKSSKTSYKILDGTEINFIPN